MPPACLMASFTVPKILFEKFGLKGLKWSFWPMPPKLNMLPKGLLLLGFIGVVYEGL